MPFKFKLSKRLALLKASLAASAALALACDRTDLTSPQPSPRPLAAAVTSLSVLSVTASGNDGNVPQNTLDNNLATRWSAYGDGQWIRYDLGALTAIDGVNIAWYLGDSRSAHFDIQVSLDTVTWTTVFSGQSSGLTTQFEPYAFPSVAARYLRIMGHGQWSGPTLLTLWNSITEVAVQGTALPTLSVAAVVASGNDGNVPQNTLDNNLATRWSAYGDGQWIRYDLGALTAIDGVNIAWYLGSPVVNGPSRFDIQVSLDTITWTTVFSGQSSGLTTQFERYAFPPAAGRYVRVVGHGNSMNAWNSITEVVLYDPPDTATATGTNVPVASVTVSPASVNILVGATVQLTATLKDSAGHVLSGRTVSWTSGNPVVATVSASGLVTGLTVGTATITATSEGVSGTAAMTVTTATSGAPQPGATDTIVFQEGFESGNYSSWTQKPASDRYSISSDPTRVHSGGYSLQVLYTPTDLYGELVRWFMPGYDEIYVKFYVMFEEGFDHGPHFVVVCGNNINDSGSCFGKAAVVPNGSDFFYAGIDPDYNGTEVLLPLSYYTYWPDMSCCYGNRFYQTAPQIPLVGGQWQEVVYHIKLNTPGQSNGSQTLWVNGVKKIDMQNMRWRTTTDLRANMLRLDNWTSYVTKTEHLWMDDITVWRP